MATVMSLRIQILPIKLLYPSQFVGFAGQLAPLSSTISAAAPGFVISIKRIIKRAECSFKEAISQKLLNHFVLVTHGLKGLHAHS